MKYAMLVLKNLTRSKRRTILTVLSIAVSLFIFSALVSMPAVANRFLADSASTTRVACHNKAGVTYALPEAYKQRIAVTPHVAAVSAQSWFGGVYHEISDQFPNMAVDPEMVGEMWPDWDISPQALHDFQRIRTGALVGTETMKKFGFRIGQQIMLRGTIYPFNVTLNIVGTLGGKAPPSFLLFRRDYLEEAAGRPGFVDVIWVKVDNSAQVPQVIASLDEGFANSSAETLTEPEAAFYGGFLAGYRLFFQIAELMGIVVVFTIGLVAANTAAMSIRERRSEIAVLRSIGFPARVILSMLLAESLTIALAGGLLGAGAAYLVLKLVTMEGVIGAIQMPASVLFEALVAAALIGLLSAIVPASAAARRNIVDALRAVA
ncbi:MAG TPA: ABC transporter permease [Candidatus Binataceae bacterium]|nr:ABC transporter permease [Candidatus Binataceae bacterium]